MKPLLSRAIKSLVAATFLSVIFSLFYCQNGSALQTDFLNDVMTFPINRELLFNEGTTANIYNRVTNIFEYTITPDENNPSGALHEPTTAQIEFTSVQPTIVGDMGIDALVHNTSTIVFATDDGNDNNDTTYSAPGLYYYTVTETSSTNPGLYPIDNTTYTIVVNVYYDVDANQIPDNTKLVAEIVQQAIDGGGNKIGTLNNVLWSSDVEYSAFGLAAFTYGDLANTSTCFDYTVYIPADAPVYANDTFHLATLSDIYNGTPTSCAPPGSGGYYTITAGTPITISMRHGDAAYAQLPAGASYTITAVVAASDEYTASVDGSTTELSKTKEAKFLTMNELIRQYEAGNPTDNAIILGRTKQSDVLSGIFTNIWTYTILLFIVTFGVFITIKRIDKNKKHFKDKTISIH